ncbi:MAG: hypothetical protein IKK20_01275, partial [Clostridia bacterium]|nr:hypothetical protein [Clostridia bacterium]
MTNKEKEERSRYLKEFIFERCCLLGDSSLSKDDKEIMYWNTIEAFILYICEPNNLSPTIIIRPDEDMGNSRATYNPNTNEIKIKQSLWNYEHT